uniref:Domain of unknown function at the cortex 1 domain-containing protein n=1 Tax=Chromera velia CCMP2878 TaxID=1169474 RepID=A0A0G4G3C3_9ALVE|eukprot:Cvel_4117.t1-p1 / transcript=Cvel_4117.t1 / gene=Cvel_4117 / organism=Chromera_velia_CCMP2878 / gene_product=hypothetical protein / transcript_product=hypothetical protein / location=Cvel_scaffold176:5429-13234(+) / protein_length=500 / sequence_SO=supercontig / SO=protein_coding / is_pseudo=false
MEGEGIGRLQHKPTLNSISSDDLRCVAFELWKSRALSREVSPVSPHRLERTNSEFKSAIEGPLDEIAEKESEQDTKSDSNGEARSSGSPKPFHSQSHRRQQQLAQSECADTHWPHFTTAAHRAHSEEPELRRKLDALYERLNPVWEIPGQGAVRLPPNARRPVSFSTDLMEGQMLLMVRGEPLDPIVAHHMEGKNRMFEMQMQVRFKQKPRGILFFAGELDTKMKLDWITHGMCKMMLGLVKALPVGKVFHYSFGQLGKEKGQGGWGRGGKKGPQSGAAEGSNHQELVERPHLAFPLAYYADRMVVTPAGEELPVLGRDIQETSAQLSARRALFSSSTSASELRNYFVPGNTYTFCMYSQYLDLLGHRCVRVPGIGSVGLQKFWGESSARFVLYDFGTFHEAHDTPEGSAGSAIGARSGGGRTAGGRTERGDGLKDHCPAAHLQSEKRQLAVEQRRVSSELAGGRGGGQAGGVGRPSGGWAVVVTGHFVSRGSEEPVEGW